MAVMQDATSTAAWAQRQDFVILDAGFGQGQRFLRTWAEWQSDPDKCTRLYYVALGVKAPFKAAIGDDPATQALVPRLAEAWPKLTPGLHTLVFDEGPASQLTLLLGVGEVADLVPQLMAHVDAFWLDGVLPAPLAANGDEGWLSRLARLAAPGAVALAQTDAKNVMAGLTQSQFKVQATDPLAVRSSLVKLRFEPHHTPAPLAGGLWPTRMAPDRRHALVIGAGLAGCAATWALARQGWRVTLVDAKSAPAQCASGNPGGLFHSIVHGEDGIHARAHRAAALRTTALVTPWLAEGRLAGACQGLLRLDTSTSAADAHRLAKHLGLPPEHVQWLEQNEAGAIAGINVPSGGWLFHQGGWLDPAAYAQALLDDAGCHADVVFMPNRTVRHLQRANDHAQAMWQAVDAQGHAIAEAPVVILASAVNTAMLAQTLPGVAALPFAPVRGQISSLPAQEGVVAPFIPVAGSGYVLPVHHGRLLFGATSQADDLDPSVRDADHAHNLVQAAQLGSLPMPHADSSLPAGIDGRVGWRAVTPDRLPYVGPLPLADAATSAVAGQRSPRTDQVRFVPRLRNEQGGGVYVIAGLGSRGITWAALAGELLASWVTGSPSLIEGPLRDALDPARLVTRAKARNQNSG